MGFFQTISSSLILIMDGKDIVFASDGIKVILTHGNHVLVAIYNGYVWQHVQVICTMVIQGTRV